MAKQKPTLREIQEKEAKIKQRLASDILMLKHDYNIKFNIVSEEDAMNFIRNNNHWTKLISYVDSFNKHNSGCYSGKPRDLEFAYLRDLSSIDMHFRKVLISLTLDLEHSLRTKLLNHMEDNENFDEYRFIENISGDFDESFDDMMSYLKGSQYSCHIASRYFKRKNKKFSDIVELFSFGDLVYVIQKYIDLYPGFITPAHHGLLFNAKMLRNVAAHNNAILTTLHPDKWRIKSDVQQIKQLANLPDMTDDLKNKFLQNQLLVDFASLLRTSKKHCSIELISSRKKELTHLFTVRCQREKKYYTLHKHILDFFEDMAKIIDIFLR